MPGNIRIKDIRMLITPYPSFVHEDANMDEIAKMMIANPKARSVYVVDKKLRLIGKITLKMLVRQEFRDLIPLSSTSSFYSLEWIGKKYAKEIMAEPVYVKDNDTLKTAFIKMYENGLDELPVVDEKMHLIGNIDMLELLTMLIEKKEQERNKKYLRLNINRPFQKRF
ncbi:MAG: CBS domain-containing protein [Thermoplasmata archaeon]|nr:MAG: CBS domain-containing protein [Thermoplasmata archaeon]RLF36096.1 MAG: CBS domain-containing protein [Thermoplasmata archaeon]